MSGIRCNTAPGIEFESREALLAHYKTEWHRYNLKRKVANLPMVPLEMFEKLQMIAKEREDAKNKESKKQDHRKIENRVEGELIRNPSADNSKNRELDSDFDEDLDDGENKELIHEVDEEQLRKKVNVLECFMDGHVSQSIPDNLLYMQQKFGFFIPEVECLRDAAGMIEYCTQKVMAGRICLYCDRPFHSGQAAIQHMLAKSHCKIRWECDEDLEEYEDYYDFSKYAPEAEYADNPSKSNRSKLTVEIMDTGELLLANKETGEKRIIGTREFHYIYRQRFKPEDSRQAVIANTKEKLMLSYRQAGVETSTELARTMYLGLRPDWMNTTVVREQRRAQTQQMKLRQRDGLQNNLLVKHRVAGKNMGAGHGVHG